MANVRWARAAVVLDVAVDRSRTQKQFTRDKYVDSQMVNDETETGTVATSGTRVVSLGSASPAHLVYIESSAPLEVRLNGAGAGPVMSPLPLGVGQGSDPTPKARFYFEGSVTAITLVNPSSTVAVDYTVYAVS